jgi:beta-lactamase regulating signal transducer with metallopeptidase domain
MDILGTLLEITIYSAVIFAATMLLKVCLKNKMSAFLHCAVWAVLIVRLMLPVTFSSPVHLSVIPDAPQPKVEAQARPDMAQPAITRQTNVSNEAAMQQPAPSASVQTQVKTTPIKLVAQPPASLTLPQVITIIWQAGVCICLFYLAMLYTVLRRKLRRNTAPPSHRLLALFKEIKEEMGIKADIKLVCQYEYGTPSLMFPRTIMMPMDSLAAMDDEQAGFALRHELSHYKRGDHIASILLSLLNAVYWFNPVVWIAFRQIRLDMETACDGAVVKNLSPGTRGLYAALIVKLFAQPAHRQLVLGLAHGDARKEAERRVRGIYMAGASKKSAKLVAALLAAVLLVACFTTACQPTPEKPVIIQKDNFENVINNTAQPASSSVANKQISWEDEFTKKYETKNSPSTKITVKVDASIDAQQDTGSVFSVESDNYDLDFAKKAAGYFLGDKYYDDIYTKNDLQMMILPLKRAIEGMEDINGSKGDIKSHLKLYEGQYERVPVNNAPGKLAFEKSNSNNYIGLKGYPYDGAVSQLYIGNDGKEYTAMYYIVQDGKKEYRDSNLEYTGTPARSMKKSYDEAKRIAEDAIANIYGNNMDLAQTDLYNAYTIDQTFGRALRGLLNDSCGQCYMFNFTPVYGGLPQLYAPEAQNEDDMTNEGVSMYQQKWDYEYSMKWPAQYVQVLVDDKGIVQFWGFSPTKTTGTVNKNVAMKSFDEIFEKFKKDIFYCSVWSYAGLEKVDIKIDKIVFGMIRVPVKDNPDKYYMIPAWQFIGSKTEIHLPLPDNLPKEIREASLAVGNRNYTESGKTFMVLNALDGSIVDTSYYINVKGTLEKTIGVEKE